jgi:glycosyltransferase involved in cell wall biosynthesis
LLRAARVLVDRGREFRCVLVGGGARAEMLASLADELGVADHVVFTGPVDHLDIPDYYGLIDVFVVPRVNERAARYVTPLKPFEAMALAKPVVVSDLPALTEIVAPPERGLTFGAGDPEHLADVVAALWDDPVESARLGAAGLEWVRNARTWAMNGPRYLEVFDRARAAAADREVTA